MPARFKRISQSAVKAMKLKAKPRCPFCKTPLTFVYADAVGHINEKCKCGNSFVIDLQTLELQQVVEDEEQLVI